MKLKIAREDVWAASMEDKPGQLAQKLDSLAQAGINLRGFSGASIGKNAVFHMAFTTAAAAGKAIGCLKKF